VRDTIPNLGFSFQARWALFRALERLSDLRGNSAAGHLQVTAPTRPEPALWVFVSTIGELNAIDPLLRELTAQLSKLRLVLITDHPHYRPSFEARFPQSVVCVSRGHSNDAAALARQHPPKMLVVAEIPCLPSDAPCRFSMAFVVEARRHHASAAVVNGWLYHYTPASRMDTIERRWFGRDYLHGFDRLCVQTDAVAERLIALGADRACTVVTGNVKFDAMQRSGWTLACARSPGLLGGLLTARRPTVVAGCVTNLEEQTLVLEAFARLRARHS
jgi:3-deoxy-D-manno-octulosonic-acid transferase